MHDMQLGVILRAYPKDMCFKEIRLHAQNMLTILGLLFNIIGGGGRGLCDHLISSRIFTLMMNMIFI